MTKRNSIARFTSINLIGYVASAIIMLISVPKYISLFGSSRYSIIIIAWSLIGFMGFFDFGISRATTNAISKTDIINNNGANEVYWTALFSNFLLGVAAWPILYFSLYYIFSNVLSVPSNIKLEVYAALPWMAGLLPIALLMGVGAGTLEAKGRFAILNATQTAGLAFGQLLPLILVNSSESSLPIIIKIIFISRVVTCSIILAVSVYSLGKNRSIKFSFGSLKNLISFGGWIAVSNIISPIMTDVDQFVIGSISPISMITFYAVPLNIVSRIQIISSSFGRALFPLFSKIDEKKSRVLLDVSIRKISTVMAIPCLLAIAFGEVVLNYWVGSEMAEKGGRVLEILSIGIFFNSVAFVPYTCLQAQNRAKLVSIAHAVELLPYIFSMWVLVKNFGIIGAALAWSMRAIADFGALYRLSRASRVRLKHVINISIYFVAILSINSLGGNYFIYRLCADFAICFLFMKRNWKDIFFIFRKILPPNLWRH